MILLIALSLCQISEIILILKILRGQPGGSDNLPVHFLLIVPELPRFGLGGIGG